MTYVPMFSPLFREIDPLNTSDPTTEPEVMLYASDGSDSPKTFVLFAAVSVIGRSETVRFDPANVIA